jgi:Fe-S cluster biogenesis protein NfuA
MTKHGEVEQRAKSIEALISTLEASADPALKSTAQELVQVLMELHAACLERMLEMLRETGDLGKDVVRRFGKDELARSVLILHGLHPENIDTRVKEALEDTKGFLKKHDAIAEVISVDETGIVTVHFQVQSRGCGSGAGLVKQKLEAVLEEAAPDATRIVIEDKSSVSASGSGFVSLAELQGWQDRQGLSAARGVGSEK